MISLQEFSEQLIRVATDEKNTETENNISQSQKKDVIETRSEKKNMKLTNQDQITDDSMKELSASAVRDFISETIQKASEEYVGKKDEAKKSLDLAQAQFEEITKEFESNKTKLAEQDVELVALRAEKEETLKAEKFDERIKGKKLKKKQKLLRL